MYKYVFYGEKRMHKYIIACETASVRGGDLLWKQSTIPSDKSLRCSAPGEKCRVLQDATIWLNTNLHQAYHT